MKSSNPTFDAVEYAVSVLQQAELLAAVASASPEVSYGTEVGPHLRHVIEHFQLFLNGLRSGVINYDRRERELSLERDMAVLRERIVGLIWSLRALKSADMQATVEVLLLGQVDGSLQFNVPSSVMRELLFVTSHATHHYALLANLLRARGVKLPEGFGKAPATVNHEVQQQVKWGAIA